MKKELLITLIGNDQQLNEAKDHIPPIMDRLKACRKDLQNETAEVDEVIRMLEVNPELEKVLTVLVKNGIA